MRIAAGRNKKAVLAILFFIMLMDVIGLSLFFPVTPFIVGRYSPEAIMVTLLSVIYSAAQFIAAPVLGKLSDRLGRRPVLLWSVAGSAVGYLVFGVAGSLWVLFASRLISGLAGGNMSTASAGIADVSEPQERSKNFMLVGLAWGVGLVAGPALGSALGQWNPNAPAFLAAALMAICLVSGFFLLPETLPDEHRETGRLTVSSLNPFTAIVAMLRKPATGWLLLVMCMFNLAVNGTNSVGSLYLIRRFAAQPWQVGLLMVAVGVAVALVQTVLIPILTPRAGERKVAAMSFAGLALCGVAMFFNPLYVVFFILYVLMSGIGGLVYPSMTTLATGSVENREVGGLIGVMTALGSLMNIAGPLWAGLAFDNLSPEAPFLIGGVLLVGAFAMFALRLRNAPAGPARGTQTAAVGGAEDG